LSIRVAEANIAVTVSAAALQPARKVVGAANEADGA